MSYIVAVSHNAGSTAHGLFRDEQSAKTTAERWNRAFARQWPDNDDRPRAFPLPLLGKDAATRDRIWSPDGAVGGDRERAGAR